MRLAIIMAASAAIAYAANPAKAANFEDPPEEAPSLSLPSTQVSGEGFHIQDPVHSDGLMHHYVVESRFGTFSAYGRSALAIRLQEVSALATIARTSDAQVVLNSVTRGIHEDVHSVKQVATHPVGVVLGIPKGISHLLGGYGAQAQEASQQAKQALHTGDAKSKGGTKGSGDWLAKHYATNYALRYLGLTAAERRWYAKLGVDPYTNNEVLRAAVKRLAKVDAAASFGMRFAPIGVPFAGELNHALEAIYNEDPAVLRKRRHQALAGYGLTAAEVAQFENHLLLSPTRQTLLVNAVESLAGVADRAELLRHASEVTTEEEMEVFLDSTRLLVQFHAHQPVTRIIGGVRVPTACLADGHLAVFGAFDAVYWTEDVVGYARALREALAPENAVGLDVWLAGTVSPRARAEIEHLGWEVHDQSPTL